MESFEKLIPIIFLIIWTVIAVLGKKKKKQARSTDKVIKPAPATPFDKLQNTFKDLFAELKQPVEEKLPETLKPQKIKIPETGKTSTQKDTERAIESEISDKDIKPRPSKPPEGKSSYQTHTIKAAGTAVPVSKLQEAVIWSEILAKPVSMRDE